MKKIYKYMFILQILFFSANDNVSNILLSLRTVSVTSGTHKRMNAHATLASSNDNDERAAVSEDEDVKK